MTALEIALLLIGLVLLVGSFFITEKLSPSEMQKMADLSDEEIGKILENRLGAAENRIEEKIDEAIDGSIDKVERSLDKETNEKIMAIHEYSDTVMDEMSKTRDEITFLYSMLNDRHGEMVEMTGNLKELLGEARDTKTALDTAEMPLLQQPETIATPEIPAEEQTFVPQEGEEGESAPEGEGNHNKRILELYQQGRSEVEIAKELSLGVGEVQLVLGLSQRGRA